MSSGAVTTSPLPHLLPSTTELPHDVEEPPVALAATQPHTERQERSSEDAHYATSTQQALAENVPRQFAWSAMMQPASETVMTDASSLIRPDPIFLPAPPQEQRQHLRSMSFHDAHQDVLEAPRLRNISFSVLPKTERSHSFTAPKRVSPLSAASISLHSPSPSLLPHPLAHFDGEKRGTPASDTDVDSLHTLQSQASSLGSPRTLFGSQKLANFFRHPSASPSSIHTDPHSLSPLHDPALLNNAARRASSSSLPAANGLSSYTHGDDTYHDHLSHHYSSQHHPPGYTSHHLGSPRKQHALSKLKIAFQPGQQSSASSQQLHPGHGASSPRLGSAASHHSIFHSPTSPIKLFRRDSIRDPIATRAESPVIESSSVEKTVDPSTGYKMINSYQMIRELGRGAHGKVKLALEMNAGQYFAVKIISRKQKRRFGQRDNNEAEMRVRREIAIMKKCCHPNIIMLTEVIDDPQLHKIYLVLEYVDGGEIHWRDENERPLINEATCRAYMRDIICGLEYLHDQNILHRDIKPANLLLTSSGTIKISDFGISQWAATLTAIDADNGEITEEIPKGAGTPAFFAPELCLSIDEQDLTPIGKPADAWAVGATLYCFLFGATPFVADNEYELFRLIRATSAVEMPADPAAVSEGAKAFVRKLMQPTSHLRLSMSQAKRESWLCEGWNDRKRKQWLQQTDQWISNQKIQVTDAEVDNALTGVMQRFLTNIRRMSASLTALPRRLSTRRSSSLPGIERFQVAGSPDTTASTVSSTSTQSHQRLPSHSDRP